MSGNILPNNSLYSDGFIGEHQNVLHSLEQIVVDYRAEVDDLTDRHVDKVYEGLERTYKKQEQGRKAPNLRLKPIEQELFERLTEIAEFFLGNRFADDLTAEDREALEEAVVPVSVIIECFKRLRKSVKLWSESYGKYGYLDYIGNFLTGSITPE